MTTNSPRISVNELATFMVSSDTARKSIVKRAREPKKEYIVARYRDARAPIRKFLVDPDHDPQVLREAERELSLREFDSDLGPMLKDDARKSIDVLRDIEEMLDKLETYRFLPSPLQQSKLVIADVQVSVYADLLVYGRKGERDEAGAAVLRMTKDDASTRTSKEKRKEMGEYVATLAMMHVEHLAIKNRVPANRLCMSIDVQHGAVFTAPRHYVRRRNDLESACAFIAAIWDTVSDL